MEKLIINRNTISSIEIEEDECIIRINDASQTIYRCPKIFEMKAEDLYDDLELEYTDMRYIKRNDQVKVDLVFYIKRAKTNFIELPKETIEE